MNDAVSEVMNDVVSEDVTAKLNVFQQFLEDLPQKALNLGIRVLLAFVFFLVGVQIIKLIRRIVKRSLSRANADIGVQQFLDSFLKVTLYTILIFMIASGFGLDATSVVAVLGSAGVAIGLALQGSLSNFAGGVLILLLKPFKVGDYIIEDNKGNEGTVSEIQMFYTKLVTPDEKVIILPNGTLANTSLTNVTATPYRRLDLSIGISYTADLRKAKEVANAVLSADTSPIRDMEMTTIIDKLGNSAVELIVRCYVTNEDYWPARSRLFENLKLAFDANGIEIPYDQLDVHVKE